MKNDSTVTSKCPKYGHHVFNGMPFGSTREDLLDEMRTGFHAGSGTYFKYEPCGCIRIAHVEMRETMTPYMGPRPMLMACSWIPSNTWISAVCFVGSGGDTLERFNQARDFHGR